MAFQAATMHENAIYVLNSNIECTSDKNKNIIAMPVKPAVWII
jgi:hypothetical protein